MNSFDHALRAYGLREIRRACEHQPFDAFSVSETPQFLSWRQLEAHTRQAHPGKPWLRNVIFVTFAPDGDGPGEMYLHESCLPFETAPCAEELAEALHAEARRLDLAESAGPVLVYDVAIGELEDLSELARQQAEAEPISREVRAKVGRPHRFLRTARAMLHRAGNGTVPRRSRLAAAA
jgi:hypothetical protein